MSENVALTKKKQKSFSKSIEKTKDKIKKGDIKIEEGSPRTFKKSSKGVIYLSNIPHGFYEKELKGYFSQFGDVLKTRVARSKRTGNSKGHAFILFKDQQVAKIAAETMNNYLMGKRLIKAQLLPDDEKTRTLFIKPNYSKEHYPTKIRRLRFKKSFNAVITENTVKHTTQKALKHIKNITNKLKEAGIDYDFTPSNMPKTLPEIKEVEDNVDDSSSEDIVFTTPEEMNKNWEERKIKTDTNNKRKSNQKYVIDTPKKVKTNTIKITNESKQGKETKHKRKIKVADKKQNANNSNDSIKVERKQKKNKNNVENNKTSSMIESSKKLKKIKKNENKLVKDITMKENENNVTKGKKRLNKNLNNSESADNSSNENKENIKKSPKQQKKIENTENSVNENIENIKKEVKQKKKDKKSKKINESMDKIITGEVQEPAKKKKKNKFAVEGITKKSIKAQKISDKKASLIKGLIQTNDQDQVKAVKKIEKKKNKKKINQS